MSKMSQLHAELSEQAYELGYLTLDQALADGYEVDYRTSRLEKSVDGREQAHEEWLKEKEDILKRLQSLYDYFVATEMDSFNTGCVETVKDTINFIKKGEA